jgi:hypothetical protein
MCVRAQCVFEQGLARAADMQMRRTVEKLEGQNLPIPDYIFLLTHRPPKLIDISGEDAVLPHETETTMTALLASVKADLEMAKFTSEYDRDAVFSMLSDSEKTMRTGIAYKSKVRRRRLGRRFQWGF